MLRKEREEEEENDSSDDSDEKQIIQPWSRRPVEREKVPGALWVYGFV